MAALQRLETYTFGGIRSNLCETEVCLFDLLVSKRATYWTLLKNHLKNERTTRYSMKYRENGLQIGNGKQLFAISYLDTNSW